MFVVISQLGDILFLETGPDNPAKVLIFHNESLLILDYDENHRFLKSILTKMNEIK